MSKYTLKFSSKFKKQYKKLTSNDQTLIDEVIEDLSNKNKLDKKYLDHQLKGKFKDYRECHVKPDLLLIYRYLDDELILYLAFVGSHSELF